MTGTLPTSVDELVSGALSFIEQERKANVIERLNELGVTDVAIENARFITDQVVQEQDLLKPFEAKRFIAHLDKSMNSHIFTFCVCYIALFFSLIQ